MKKKISVIGSGFSGLSATAYLAKAGDEVHVFEKHDRPGGRARQFSTEQGYVFDMGPSWYWMPDIIESFFADFGYKTSDFFELISLNPQFEMIFSEEKINVPQSLEELKILFESHGFPGYSNTNDTNRRCGLRIYTVSFGTFLF